MPSQLQQFVEQTRRLSSPPTQTLARAYGKTFRAWYTRLMPDWRKPVGRKAWPLPRTSTLTTENWTAVRKGGQHGVVLVLLGLAWWKAATVAGTAERDDYQDTVEDFSWVMSHLCAVAPASLLPDGSTLGLTHCHPSTSAARGSSESHTTPQHLPSPPSTAPLDANEPTRARRGRKRAIESGEEPVRATQARKKVRT